MSTVTPLVSSHSNLFSEHYVPGLSLLQKYPVHIVYLFIFSAGYCLENVFL